MLWLIVVFVVAAALIIGRIYLKLRNLQRTRRETWDAQVIGRLRSQGYAPFKDYKVDFFLALPDEVACQRVRARLEPEGFSVDVKPLESDSELAFSLHASKMMRLIVPDMQDLSRRMTELAGEYQGRYDGWAA